MAGGMRSKHATPVPLAMRGNRPDATPTEQPARRRHCWIHRPTGDLEGLIIEWRRHNLGWQALVTYVDGSQTVTAWLPAESLRPADHEVGSDAQSVARDHERTVDGVVGHPVLDEVMRDVLSLDAQDFGCFV